MLRKHGNIGVQHLTLTMIIMRNSSLNGLMVTPVKTRYGIIFMRSVSEDAGSVLKQMGIEYSEKILNSAQTA
ncbi:MAG: hypothetical protein M1393_08370 [Candidatus Thermoplasmatota archaeon]|nr:hypothetical protein [Candidatus Thermoplasmatota archaeon]MDA8142432.1 hypothetical protein [Thermoplasmatales archaeon]